jgi:hypothetical protein
MMSRETKPTFSGLLRPALIGALIALPMIAIPVGPAQACEAIHTIIRRPNGPPQPVPPPFTICWGGPCVVNLGVRDAMGRFKVIKTTPDWLIDHITMIMQNPGNPGHDQTLVAAKTGPVCNPPAGTVQGCTERYKVPNIKACPLGTAPCSPGQKVTLNLENLDQVNTVTTGGQLVLGDGQVVQGRRDNNFWLHFEVCCPDLGRFGAPGDTIVQTTTYTEQFNNNPATCNTVTPKTNNPTDVIPQQTFPCP